MRTVIVVWLVLTTCGVVAADTLPNKPVPVPSRTVDRDFVVEAGALAAAWTTDAVTTQRWIAGCAPCVEGGGLLNGSRDGAAIMGAWAAVDIGAVVVAYELKRHVRNKWLNWVWRGPLIFQIEGHTQAAWLNSR